MKTIYAIAKDTGHGWLELRFKYNSDLKINNAVPGQWYSIPSTRAHEFVVNEPGVYKITAEDLWVDTRPPYDKFNVIRIHGEYSVEKYDKAN